jgi:uncharacterized repeat protein (TIGR01451 family)
MIAARRLSILIGGLVAAVGLLSPAGAFAGTADIAVTKIDSADPVLDGGRFTYGIRVRNTGPDVANAVQVVDRMPAGLKIVEATATQGGCSVSGRKATCNLGALADGASQAARIRVEALRPGTVSNTATASTADDDPDRSDNTSTQTTMIVPAPTCAGRKATLVGTEGDDNLIGTVKRDVIVALGGNDTIEGLDGFDVICAADGNDALKGQEDNDILRSGTGADTVRGGGGNDEIRALGGGDDVSGGRGDDAVRGGGGDDLLRGLGGSDFLRGGSGRDALRGGGGPDACNGGGGRDSERGC